MPIPETTREQVIEAMGRFDREMRESKEWAGWEARGNFRWALTHAGSFYPPKEIISLATGVETSTFSGGPSSNSYLQNLGFAIEPLRASGAPGAETGLHDALVGILKEYPDARARDVNSKDHTVADRFRVAQENLRRSLALKIRPAIQVEYSTGKGNWASVPWIALLDRRETTSTQRGRYVVFLFRSDCSGVYLTLNQGVTQPKTELGKAAGLRSLRERAIEMRELVTELTAAGFALNDEIQLKANGLGADYEASTVAHKFYPAEGIPSDDEIYADVEAVLSAYGRVLSPTPAAASKPRAWIFQANPEIFDATAAVRELTVMTWKVNQHAADIHVGDRVYVWESGPAAGIVAIAEVTAEVDARENDAASLRFVLTPQDFLGPKPRTVLRIIRVLDEKLLKKRFLGDARFADLAFLKAPMGTNFPLTDAHRKAIDDMLELARDLGPADLCVSFSAALRASGLAFGVNHDDIVRIFFASVLAKPFIVLTGLSGSGKTQLALKLGEWLGEGRYRVIPVRPDWTGPESLLGYEDALLPINGNRRAWHVPEALQLMLRAAREPDRPHLLAGR